MTAILGMIFSKDGFYGALIVAGLIFGVHLHHKVLAEGIAEQKAADDKATAILVANTAKQTAELQARATTAEQAYDKEQSDLVNYRAADKLQPVRLCISPKQPSGSVVPKTGAQVGGNQTASTTSGGIQQVPSGDSSSGAGAAGPDISGMLDLLAARADQVSSELREDQARE